MSPMRDRGAIIWNFIVKNLQSFGRFFIDHCVVFDLCFFLVYLPQLSVRRAKMLKVKIWNVTVRLTPLSFLWIINRSQLVFNKFVRSWCYLLPLLDVVHSPRPGSFLFCVQIQTCQRLFWWTIKVKHWVVETPSQFFNRWPQRINGYFNVFNLNKLAVSTVQIFYPGLMERNASWYLGHKRLVPPTLAGHPQVSFLHVAI